MADRQLKDFQTTSAIASDDKIYISDTSDSGYDKGITVANSGLVNVYVQTDSPGTSGILPNSIWFDTDDNNKLYVFNSGTSTWTQRTFTGSGTVPLTGLENIDQYEFLGRDTVGTGSVEALSRSDAQSAINDGQWIGISNITDIADGRILGNNSGGDGPPLALTDAQVRTIILDNGVITNAMLTDMAANTIKSNATGGSTDPSDLEITANTFPARGATGNLEAKTITTLGLSLLDDTTTADMQSTLGITNYDAISSYTLSTRGISAGTSYAAGYYEFSATDANLSNSGTTQTMGTANIQYAAHAFAVAGAGGTTDGSDLVLTVSGTSLADDGTRTAADSEVIVADCVGASTDEYFQTTKKWVGQITYTLSSSGGSTFSFDFNYGLVKAEDFNAVDFTVKGFQAVGDAGASDSSFDIALLHHTTTGWTYAASGFAPSPTDICRLTTDNGTENQAANGEYFGYKRNNLNTAVSGSGDDGVIIEVTTGQTGTVNLMNLQITASRPFQ
jgi:hypothetical protein